MSSKTPPSTTKPRADEGYNPEGLPEGGGDGYLSDDALATIDAWWRANMYLTIGQIYLGDNVLVRRELKSSDIKPRLLGHWGTSPGLAFIWAHVSRLIRRTGQQCLYVAGPGHGGPAIVAASYLEGTYTPAFPHVTQDEAGLRTLFRQFSAPGGIPSHASVTTPGSPTSATAAVPRWPWPDGRGRCAAG